MNKEGGCSMWIFRTKVSPWSTLNEKTQDFIMRKLTTESNEKANKISHRFSERNPMEMLLMVGK